MLNSLRSRWNFSLLGSRLAATALPSTLLPPSSSSSLRQTTTLLAETLPAARAAFEQALADLEGEGLKAQRGAIRRACSLHDLWHLRTGLYNEIARQLSQAEAEQRLSALHGYFQLPQGAPR
jgi:hypothetical protein